MVDEIPAMRDMLRYIFQAGNFENVSLASSEKEAIDIINEKTILLVLTERMVPGGTCLSFVKWTRAQKPELPIIVVSGFNSKEDVLEVRRAGENDCILKPIVPKVVIQKTVEQLEHIEQFKAFSQASMLLSLKCT